MRSVKYGSILNRVAMMAGLDPAAILHEQEAVLNGFINKALRFGWERHQWPEVCPLGEERDVEAGFLISYDQPAEDPIGEVFKIWKNDPFLRQYPQELSWYLTPDGIRLVGLTTQDVAYLYYRKRAPSLFGADHDALASYSAGDQVYDSVSEDYYRARINSPGTTLSNAAHWERLAIPYVLSEYIIHSAYADWLRSEGASEKAALEDTLAEGYIHMEIDKVERQQGQVVPTVFRTHTAVQAR